MTKTYNASIVRCQDPESVGAQAADIIISAIKEHERSHPERPFVLGLCTGGTPIPTYNELIRRNRAGEFSFENVWTFNLDEYLGLNGDHEQSYRYFMDTYLFNHIDIDKSHTAVPSGVSRDAETECASYEQRIQQMGGIDLWLIGIGPHTGHIAFNEPGSSIDSRTRIVNLTQHTIEANKRFFENDMSKVPTKAISAGVGTILSARKIVLIATGANKSDVVFKSLKCPMTESCPASFLQSHPQVTYVVDRDAAAEISE